MSTEVKEYYRVIKGLRFRYLQGGMGPPLVLCHGWIGSAENFDTWLAQLTQIRTVIIPDLPGNGETAPLTGTHNSAALAVAVEALIDELGIASFDLAGLCLGASVALELLQKKNDAVRSLILHTPMLTPEVITRSTKIQAGLFTPSLIWPIAIWMSRQRFISDVYKLFIVEGSDVDKAAAEMNFRNQKRMNPRASREWLLSGLGTNYLELLAHTDKPSLVLVAQHDRLVDSHGLETLTAGLEHVTTTVIADTGHGWNELLMQKQMAAITGFLQSATLESGVILVSV